MIDPSYFQSFSTSNVKMSHKLIFLDKTNVEHKRIRFGCSVNDGNHLWCALQVISQHTLGCLFLNLLLWDHVKFEI